MYLLDTDILSNLMKRKPSVRLQARVASVPAEAQFSSSITLGELMFGEEEGFEQVGAGGRRPRGVVPADVALRRRRGETIRRHTSGTRAAGNADRDADLRIASIALARGLVVVTGNTKHFARVPELVLENWLW